jgi:hypothetical protein
VVAVLSAQPNWPTPETKKMWLDFTRQFIQHDSRIWAERNYRANVQWYAVPAPPGAPLNLYHSKGQPVVLSADGVALGVLNHPLNPNRRGLVCATVSLQAGEVNLRYLGPNDLWVV